MRGGMTVYRGAAAAARRYLEADRSRADDYYLAEGTGIAERYVASPGVGARLAGTLSGDEYEAWASGIDPETGVAKGHLRTDKNAVRFVEVTVNGPKSWSLAAAIHPDISAAYDAAQERAAEQIIGWLAAHSTTRIGPRGAQVQVPVSEIEAVTVRHYTSRAGDPHRHLHLQINARVRAEGRWYGLHTVGVRDSLDAINGIGHAAMMTDPDFRAALAAHGYTLDGSGEITQMREYVGAFSARTKQIERNLDRYEAAWRKANLGQEPGPRLRLSWDHRAWAEARPDKVVPKDGAEVNAHWVAELHALGYRDPAGPVLDMGIRPGEIDRDRAVGTVLARLGARRSAWNAADVRGEAEQLIARSGVVTDAAIRSELAEDLTVRTLAECVPLLDRPGLPEHLRALTSRGVLDVEADLTVRLIDRADATPTRRTVPAEVAAGLDVAQRAVVQAFAGDAELLVVAGAAGVGKTTTLAAARTAIEAQEHRLVVVTPTRKAAQVAGRQLGTWAFSAAWLAHQHGWRWDANGTWTRLDTGQIDPGSRHPGRQYVGPQHEAVLRAGDVLLVDEAGMLDQDTARALLHVTDDAGARLVLMGDRHQLPAVGRGGVLDLAARFAAPGACLELATVHRFTDPDYAPLSLAMRTGENPEQLFDTLATKGLVQVHASEIERVDALADDAVSALTSGQRVRVLADTNDQVAQLNTAIRERLIRAGQVDDSRAMTTRAGQLLGAGDLVMTRENDSTLDVANREVWTVTAVYRDGNLTVTGEQGRRTLPPEYVRTQVELAYASTVHATQGETADTAHFALGEHTGAANAYVALTRGRDANTVHIVAEDIEQARELWVETFSRDRADLGPTVAAHRAAVEADRYAPQQPLADALADLRLAWTAEADARRYLVRATSDRDQLREFLTAKAEHDATIAPLDAARWQARDAAARARQHAEHVGQIVDTDATRYAAQLQQQWNQLRPAARDAARTVLDGAGRLGLHRRAVHQAQTELGQWAEVWRPIVTDLPTDPAQLARIVAGYDTSHVYSAIGTYAHTAAEHAHPEHRVAVETAQTTAERARQADAAYHRTVGDLDRRLIRFGILAIICDPEARLPRADWRVTELTTQHDAAIDQVRTLLGEPALRSLPAERLRAERDTWRQDHDMQLAAEQQATALAGEPTQVHRHNPTLGHSPLQLPQQGHGISI